MALIHASSLERWQEWERSHHRARRAKHALVGLLSRKRAEAGAAEPARPGLVLHSRAAAPDADATGGRILFAVDSASPTSRASLLTALPYLHSGVDVLAPAGLDLPELTGWEREDVTDAPAQLRERGLTSVVSLGQHLEAGFEAHRFARYAGVRSVVVQHGALTPYAPPLPRESELLAWTEADGSFYRSGRTDVEVTAVGSQLLWEARHEGGEVPGVSGEGADGQELRPMFLGQLHGVELPRRVTGGAAFSFCRDNQGIYRPHPSETDLLSRRTHGLMKRAGIEFADTSIPLREVPNPVVAVFSTGVLEAAARGIPAWVHAPKAPIWVHEFWARYRMSRWGTGTPTPAPEVPAQEPGVSIAEILEGEG